MSDVAIAVIGAILSLLIVAIVGLNVQLTKLRERVSWLEAKANGKPSER